MVGTRREAFHISHTSLPLNQCGKGRELLIWGGCSVVWVKRIDGFSVSLFPSVHKGELRPISKSHRCLPESWFQQGGRG